MLFCVYNSFPYTFNVSSRLLLLVLVKRDCAKSARLVNEMTVPRRTNLKLPYYYFSLPKEYWHQGTVSRLVLAWTILLAFEQIVRDDPFLPLLVAPQFGTSQEEQTPVDVPKFLFALAIRLCQNRLKLSILPVLVQIVEPVGERIRVGKVMVPSLRRWITRILLTIHWRSSHSGFRWHASGSK